MVISLLVISAQTGDELFWTPKTIAQTQRFGVGALVFLLFATLDYSKLREWTWFLYLGMVLSLVGLFFVGKTAGVQRWYALPGFAFQPSETAKLIVVLALAWYLERARAHSASWRTAIRASLIAGLPFLLILKQPDLGTAMVLWPITLVIFYFGGVRRSLLKGMVWISFIGVGVIALFFTGILDHETMRPYMTKVIKDYQYERLNPDTHHQRAAAIAIGAGGWSGSGWHKSIFSGRGWLPAAETDSVYPSFGEEFGFLGMAALLILFYILIYFGFQVTAVAKDHYGRLLSAGITVYLAMHVITNMAMMVGFLPITGVPLVLVTYGGSSVLVTMAALGTLQSIFSRRFMF